MKRGSITTLTIDASEDVERRLNEVQQMGYEGVLLLAAELRDEEWPMFERVGLPVVVLGTYLPFVAVDCVTINNWQGAYQATSTLVHEGRGCPGHIVSSVTLRNFDERADGFYAANRSGGFSSSVATHIVGPYVEEAQHDFAEVLRREGLTARCYFADNDQLALGAMRALLTAGYCIPQDVSIIGFDDLEISRYAQPTLSTVHVPKGYFGNIAVAKMLALLEPGEWHPVRIEVGTSLVLRESTLPV